MTLADYAAIVRKRWLWIVAIVILGCAASVAAGQAAAKPSYPASSKLLVGGVAANEDGAAPSQADLQANILLINTYRELVLTPPILNAVATGHPELKLSAEELAQGLAVSTQTGSQIMTLSWSDPSYERAADIVNAAAAAFKQAAKDLMHTDNVEILSEANPANPPSPSRTGVAFLLLVGLVCSAIVALPLVFLLEATDARMRNAADVERTLGYPVLAGIEASGRRARQPAAAKAPSYRRAGEDQRVHVNG